MLQCACATSDEAFDPSLAGRLLLSFKGSCGLRPPELQGKVSLTNDLVEMFGKYCC